MKESSNILTTALYKFASGFGEATPNGSGKGSCEAVRDFPMFERLVQSCESARAGAAANLAGPVSSSCCSNAEMEVRLLHPQPVNFAFLASLMRNHHQATARLALFPGGAVAPELQHQKQHGAIDQLVHQQTLGAGNAYPIRIANPTPVSRDTAHELLHNTELDLRKVTGDRSIQSSRTATCSGNAGENVSRLGTPPVQPQQELKQIAGSTREELYSLMRIEEQQQDAHLHSKRLLSDGAIGAVAGSRDMEKEMALADMRIRSRADTRDRVRPSTGMCCGYIQNTRSYRQYC